MANASKVIIGLQNPKSPTNVGGVMRAAGCYRADEVRYTGKRYALAAQHRGEQYNTDTKRVSQHIPLNGVESLLDSLDADTKVICVDLVEGATPLPAFSHPQKAIYLFGPEDGTLDQALIDCADEVVYVPTVGCMNLASSVNVLLYDRLAKGEHLSGDDLIRASRDTNNRVKVKA
ncbi:RNA methyltransferase [Shewanella loihica]|uniref:tRNA/rRNA methyltransferase (SpoU) n=1 Tax=Shewanella loihica (strain ATCC BAA-1088 / PV-4) TaxID=323850 RepID=A3QFN0_SHELP|nr:MULTISPECIES: RNA methyltransferase [Shewanella]ABO24278.1 tRNA/rRNA methyltransferase (SpoU) [Shewanella loihica PV-4]QYJ91426.1 RNA methyltransferase [Shewanella halotolerans]